MRSARAGCALSVRRRRRRNWKAARFSRRTSWSAPVFRPRERIRRRSAQEAATLLDRVGFPVVVKADGLAAGKGVVIAQTRAEALEALAQLPAGRFVIEEFLEGEEVSFIVYTDGEHVVPFEATQDHKAVWDGDKGPNTGGMGAYCDGRILTAEQQRRSWTW